MIRRNNMLEGVHPDLVRVVTRAAALADINGWDLVVLEGLRSVERERQLMAAGASMLKDPYRCRHVTGHAVDLAVYIRPVDADGDGKDDDGIFGIRWDWPLYNRLGPLVQAAAVDCHVPIEWGGDWRDFKDGPHFQLPWENYPNKEQ